ncbi:MAG: tryptophan--tRNA ligase [Candidatus Cloacimonadaceae bacterium]|jgi:tryptophanyl-tRNA synthetase|nr:tryptophan--tRNA ligase [Candidatus Cloacimonadota bacterium]MDY0127276.1 tryptophan--tRNA ligase [Candidatus Cloacimonadaceae bacterium]MCB5255208.1 tryptophan--tRNA ligase [Candidatus Cloacimonadota bacterium]MCK9177837.1 tryptophan--tRNA ligase [Candidatus Cloacimonadota bacterium]MCK9242179.1 tryptophan--tRNA ligase [Candidatus Cloacimonadota bacterium]
MKKIALTGIKPTGIPHIGNYLGAIQPALKLSETCEARYFIADYHALNATKDPVALRSMTLEIAAAWLACGLDPDKVLFYRQSDVPETFELLTILLAFTPKGLMNRAHAYKAMLQSNNETGKDPDDGVNMGLFSYPVLMAADILLFDTDLVPVGNDQFQHVEMAVDIAQSFNHIYSNQALRLPEPLSQPDSKTVVGLDGRKMSKSYGNIIPLFAPQKKLRKTVMKIVTNSQEIEEPKDPDSCSVFSLYKCFATQDEIAALQGRYIAGGMGWGEAKQELFLAMNRTLAPLRQRYEELMQNPDYIHQVLREGAAKARPLAAEKIRQLRQIIGID